MKEISSVELMGVCVSLINREVAKQSKLIEGKFSNQLVSIENLKLAEQSLSQKIIASEEKFIQELPEGIIFEAHLDDAVSSINRSLSELEDNYIKLHKTLSGEVDRALDSNTRVMDEYQEFRNTFDTLVSKLNEDTDSDDIESVSLLSTVLWKKLDSEIENKSRKISSDIFNVSSELEQYQLLSNLKIQEIIESVRGVKTDLSSKFERVEIKRLEVSQEIQNLRKEVLQSAANVKGELNQLESRLNQTVEIATRDLSKDYSKVNHEHPEYVDQYELNLLQQKVEFNNSSIREQSKAIVDLISDVQSKLTKKDAVLRSDIPNLSVDIAGKVLERIPKPADGKDGLNWEFKFDPNAVGVLMFKREDENKWQRQYIRGPKGEMGSGPGGFGGGGSVTTVDTDYTIQVDGEEVTESDTLNFKGDGVVVTVDEDGKPTVEIEGSPRYLVEEIQLSGTEYFIDIKNFGFTGYYSYKVVDSNGREVSIVIEENNLEFDICSIINMDSLTFIVRGF